MAEAHSDDEWSQARESRPGCKGRRGRDGRDAWGAGLVGCTEEQVCAAGGCGLDRPLRWPFAPTSWFCPYATLRTEPVPPALGVRAVGLGPAAQIPGRGLGQTSSRCGCSYPIACELSC